MQLPRTQRPNSRRQAKKPAPALGTGRFSVDSFRSPSNHIDQSQQRLFPSRKKALQLSVALSILSKDGRRRPVNKIIMGSYPHDGSVTFSLGGNSSVGADQKMIGRNLCKHCQHVGCDVKFVGCGCYLHARCVPISENTALTHCPICKSPTRALLLMPMNFDELDQAKAAAAAMAPSAKRGKKRKNATIARLNPSSSSNAEGDGEGSDLRTGRWTTEETLYCDKLVEKFELGQLPIPDGIKLNDFLANMLKSKQSRLTKKMKNARLSAKTYKRASGYLLGNDEAREFSQLETSFFDSIHCDMEKAEIRFHMQKEWRELFSTYCVALGQKLDADSWLCSVEEMDRRVSLAKDAARMARRKVMMGYALSQDSMNPEQGVFIEKSKSTDSRSNEILSSHASSNSLSALASRGKKQRTNGDASHPRSLRDYSSPFVGKVIQYLHRHQIPFEHLDAWVPSFVPNADQSGPVDQQQKCRLCFAGFASTETQIPPDGGRPVALKNQDQFDLLSFGEYSSKFSFDVGCGLPGRVYSSGICSWEQGVANAPSHQFERCGGASQWGIKTVLGIPIPSPNVGRIVVLLYSRHDRKRDSELVRRITDELTKLLPTPKWKLVVDVGAAPPKSDNSKAVDRRVGEVLKLMAEHVPTHRNSPYSPYLPGFTSLRLLLMKQVKLPTEEELIGTILESYSSYLSSGRSNSETAWMVARDYMLLSQSGKQQQPQQPTLQPQNVQQQQQRQQAVLQVQQQAHGLQQHQPQSVQQYQQQTQILLQPQHQQPPAPAYPLQRQSSQPFQQAQDHHQPHQPQPIQQQISHQVHLQPAQQQQQQMQVVAPHQQQHQVVQQVVIQHAQQPGQLMQAQQQQQLQHLQHTSHLQQQQSTLAQAVANAQPQSVSTVQHQQQHHQQLIPQHQRLAPHQQVVAAAPPPSQAMQQSFVPILAPSPAQQQQQQHHVGVNGAMAGAPPPAAATTTTVNNSGTLATTTTTDTTTTAQQVTNGVNRQLAPSPGFSLQQSAFQPVGGHLQYPSSPAAQQHQQQQQQQQQHQQPSPHQHHQQQQQPDNHIGV